MNLAEMQTSKAAAFTVTEVAEALGLDRRTVVRGCEDGQLPSLRVGRRLLIPRLPLLAALGAESSVTLREEKSPSIRYLREAV